MSKFSKIFFYTFAFVFFGQGANANLIAPWYRNWLEGPAHVFQCEGSTIYFRQVSYWITHSGRPTKYKNAFAEGVAGAYCTEESYKIGFEECLDDKLKNLTNRTNTAHKCHKQTNYVIPESWQKSKKSEASGSAR